MLIFIDYDIKEERLLKFLNHLDTPIFVTMRAFLHKDAMKFDKIAWRFHIEYLNDEITLPYNSVSSNAIITLGTCDWNKYLLRNRWPIGVNEQPNWKSEILGQVFSPIGTLQAQCWQLESIRKKNPFLEMNVKENVFELLEKHASSQNEENKNLFVVAIYKMEGNKLVDTKNLHSKIPKDIQKILSLEDMMGVFVFAGHLFSWSTDKKIMSYISIETENRDGSRSWSHVEAIVPNKKICKLTPKEA